MKKTITRLTFILMLLITTVAQSQITIETDDDPYYCGTVITLIAPATTTNNYSWQSSGAVLLRKVGTSGSGTATLTVTGNNKVEAIINGVGTAEYNCIGCNPTSKDTIDLAPQARPFSPNISLNSGSIHSPNGIQTRHPWICLSNDNTVKTITVRNPYKFSIVWAINGGILKQNETYNYVGGEWVATVDIVTSGPNAKKGFLAGYVTQCGVLKCGSPAIYLEVLKDLVPSEIFGVTCIKESNLNDTRSTVYSVSDDIAGNAEFNWSLIDKDGVEIFEGDNHPAFKIESKSLYNNSVTVSYNVTTTPIMAGNFTIKVSNACGGYNERVITVSPEAPSTIQETYCVSETIGVTQLLQIDNPLSTQNYTWKILGDQDWIITPSNTKGDEAMVTFNDSSSGAITVTSTNITTTGQPNCTSLETIVFINRDVSAISIEGESCIERDTSKEFSFTAKPFGKFNWQITPSLPSGYNLIGQDSNTLRITPPTTGIGISGKYSVTATLEGCTNNTATFDFEISPAIPVISGEQCVKKGVSYTYDITSEGATVADITITTASNLVTTMTKTVPGSFTYTPTTEDFEIEVTTRSSATSTCNSLSKKVAVKVQPTVDSIVYGNICTELNSTPTVTFTANTTGTATAYRWTHPSGWTNAIENGNTLTLTLDLITAGDICVIPINDGCEGEKVFLNIPRNDLNVVFTRQLFAGGLFGTITATTNKPLTMTWRYGETPQDVDGCRGKLYDQPNTNSYPYVTSDPERKYVSLNVRDEATGCERCYTFEVNSIPLNSGRSSKKVKRNNSFKKLTSSIKISPNPAQENIIITSPNKLKIASIFLFNTNGTLILEKRNITNQERIDVSTFAKGIYFIYALTNEGIQKEKIIIK